jgi:enoyl-CoA hydratase/carnithine racemase
MPDSPYQVTESDSILTFTMTRPEKLNAMLPETISGLRKAVADFGRKEELRVLVIRSTGRYFSAGMDVTGQADRYPSHSGVAFRRAYRELHLLFDEFENIEKPVVAAIQGPCLGGALEMSVSCDFRLASERATFRLPEVDLAVLPGSGGVSRLARLVGPAWTRWLVMAGQAVGAEAAIRMGLVHAVYAEANFDKEVNDFVTDLAAKPREAIGLIKLAIELCVDGDRTTGRNIERMTNSMLVGAPAHRAAVDAFASRRRAKQSKS